MNTRKQWQAVKNLVHANRGYIFVFLLLSFLYLLYFLYLPTSLEIEMKTASDSWGRVYYDTGRGYRVHNSLAFRVEQSGEFETYRVILPRKNIESIRIEPQEEEGSFAIRSIQLNNRLDSMSLEGEYLKDAALPLQNVELSYQYGILQGLSTGANPTLELAGINVINRLPALTGIMLLVIMLLLFIAAKKFFLWLDQRYNYRVKVGLNFGTIFLAALVIAAALTLVMAVNSDFNSHPDERVHYEAVKYYSKNNWVPPAIGDPETLDSYSNYGKSRLNSTDFYYLITGKFTAVLSPLTGDTLLSARLFNVFLLLILVYLAFRAPGKQRLLYGVLLLTPQVWYIFSYVNSDAFALFLVIFISAQLIHERSPLKQYLENPAFLQGFYKSVPLILAVFLLFQAKENFYLYFFFLLAWGAWYFFAVSDRKKIVVKYATMILVCLVLISAVYLLDNAIHGPTRNQDLRAMQELMADDAYKPSARYTGQGHPDLNLKSRGVHFLELFSEEYNWHRLTFYSFAGVYDYFLIFGPANYYRLMLLLYFFMAAFVTIRLWKEGLEARFFLGCIFALTISILYLAFTFAWESSFQPQGRYLFPVLGMVAYIFGRYAGELGRHSVFRGLLLAVAALSTYSFVAFGLAHIPK